MDVCGPAWLPWLLGALWGIPVGMVLGLVVAKMSIQRINRHSQM